jgi:hypothetical protein
LKVRNNIPKKVPECLILRNHSIIFSLIDFKKRLSRRDMDERLYLSAAQDEVKKIPQKLQEVSRDRKVWLH